MKENEQKKQCYKLSMNSGKKSSYDQYNWAWVLAKTPDVTVSEKKLLTHVQANWYLKRKRMLGNSKLWPEQT